MVLVVALAPVGPPDILSTPGTVGIAMDVLMAANADVVIVVAAA